MEWTRYFAVYIIQSFVIIFFLVICIKILKRNRNRLTSILSSFYLTIMIGLIFNLILLPINNNPLSTILYFITYFLVSYGQIFLVIFLRNIIKIEKNDNSKINFLIITLYGIFLSCSFFIPGWFTFNETTSWIPVYSWYFLITLYIIITIMIIIPSILYFRKLYNKFEKIELKKKIRYFTVGTYGMFFISYGVILYNTWQNPLFKLIWPFLSLIIIPSGFLIYYGIVRNL